MKGLYRTALILSVIGSINWGLVGISNINLVGALFGDNTFLSSIIYMIIGASGVYLLVDVIGRLLER